MVFDSDGNPVAYVGTNESNPDPLRQMIGGGQALVWYTDPTEITPEQRSKYPNAQIMQASEYGENHNPWNEGGSGFLSMAGDWIGEFGPILAIAFGGAALGGAAGAAGAGAGIGSADAALAMGAGLEGVGGLSAAGSASLSGASWISQLIDSGVNAIQQFGSGASEAFNPAGWLDSAQQLFTPAAESPWGANAAQLGESVSGTYPGIDAAGNAVEATTSVADAAATQAGVSPNATEFLNPVGSNGPGFTPGDSYAQAYPGSSVPGGSGLDMTSATVTGAEGWVDKALQWGKANQGIVSGAMQVGGGLLKGAGDSANLQTKLAADQAALDKKLAVEQAIADARSPAAVQASLRAQAATSGAFGQNIGFNAPATPRTLRRPDGSFVYATPGVIAGAMRRA